jgi:uncharacterized protein DUF5916/cellulose/xylan binding protein with CBM9 domain
MPRNSLGVLAIVLLPSVCAADSPARVTAPAVPQAAALKLDGEFNQTVWERAPAIGDFRQRDPKDDADPTFPTDVRVAYDATNIYVAVTAHDPEPDKLVALRTRRDSVSPSDWITVLIDSFHDRRTAFEFTVNPAGVKRDTYWYNDNNQDEGWDAVWDVAVSRDKDGWRAEFRIPFSQLRFRHAANAVFGFAVVRQIGRLNETDTWPLISKSANGYVSSFGDLTGLQLSASQNRLELVPYAVGQLKTQPDDAGNPLVSRRDPNASLGLDLKYAVRPSMTLTATVNPDFGQVEADPAVVNLSGFETFFSERRPFFVEGSGMFTFDMDCNDGSCSGLFYSRRVGRSPRGSPEVPEGGFIDVPQQTTILGAAKLTGKIGKFSVGALNAITADEKASIALGTVRTTQSVEPLTNYAVVRARREFVNQSTIGFIVANTARSLNADTSFLPGKATAGGIDWDWRLKKRYALQGYWAGSTIHGSAESIDELQTSTVHSFQRPDAEHLEYNPTATSLNGYGASVAIAKLGGSKVRFNSNVSVKSPGLDLNDLGFMRRADVRSMSNWIQFRRDTPTTHVRNFRWNLNQWASWNYGGDRMDLGYNVNAHWQFTNNWRTGTGLTVLPRPFDDRATRGGPGAYGNAKLAYWQYVEGDDRKPISIGNFFNLGADRYGTHWLGAEPFVTYRPASFLSVSGGFRYFRNVDDSQWIENADDGHYVFGHLDQSTVALTFRANYTISPQLTIQIYAEPFVSAGDYTGFKALVNGRAPQYHDRYAPFEYASNPDFNFRSFRTTNVLRWEYKPGSALFVVWQQGRQDTLDTGQFKFGRDFGGIFGAPSTNVFLVKWSYWLNY